MLDLLDERNKEDAEIIALLRKSQVSASISKGDVADDGVCNFFLQIQC